MARMNEATALNSNDRLFNVNDVARHLSVSRSKVYQMMDAGILPFVKFGKSRRVRWSHVVQLVERSTIGGDEQA